MTDELSLDFVESLLAQPETTRRSSRKPKTDERNINTWLKVEHTGTRPCEVIKHNENRPRARGYTTIVKHEGKEIAVCRICFLTSLDKDEQLNIL